MFGLLWFNRPTAPVRKASGSLVATVRQMVEERELDPADSEERFHEVLRRYRSTEAEMKAAAEARTGL